MWKEHLGHRTEILIREHEVFPIEEHSHAFFELAYVVEGTGHFRSYGPDGQCHETRYGARELFLIPPDRVHCFVIATRSRYVFLRFTEGYAADRLGVYAEHALRSVGASLRIPFREGDEALMDGQMALIAGEAERTGGYADFLLQQWLDCVIALVARNVPDAGGADGRMADREVELLQYVRSNIGFPEPLRVEALCRVFRLSPNYLGRYFRTHFQESLQHYIARTRMAESERLVAETELSIKEIACRMGYTDASYLVKRSRAAYGCSPALYRRRLQAADHPCQNCD